MDRLELQRKSVKAFLQHYANSINQYPESGIEVELVFDTERDRYLLLDVGWDGKHRVHHCIFHYVLAKRDNKIKRSAFDPSKSY